MADLQKTIEIIFGGVDNTSPAIKRITTQLGAFDQSIQSIAEPFANFTKSLIAAEAGIASLGAAMVAFSVKEAGDLQASVSEIGTLFNAQPEQVERLRQAILDYGRDSVFSFDNITTATYNMVSATGDVEGAVDALRIAEQAAVVGATDLNTSVNALTTITNAYGLELSASNEVLSAFIVAVQNGKTTLPELESSIGRVAASAASSKVPFSDLLAAVAALTGGGLNTAESMTALRAVFQAMAKPTDALKTALGGMSLESDGLQGVMKQLQSVTGGNYEQMTKLFGSVEAANGAIILANDSSGIFNKTLDAMSGRTEVLSKNFDLMSKNADLALQNLVNNLKATLVSVGQPLLDEFGSSVAALSNIFKTLGIEIESGSLKVLEDALERFAGNASQLLNDIAEALPDALDRVDFTGLLAAFEDLGDTFGEVFEQIFGNDLDLSKPEDLAKALQSAVNIAESFVNITAGIIQQFNPIFAALGEAGQRISETSTQSQDAIGRFLGAMTLLSEFGTALGTLAIVINETQADVANVFDLIGGAAKSLVNVIQTVFDFVVLTIATALRGIAEMAETILPDALGGEFFGNAAIKLEEFGRAVSQNLVRNAREAGDGLTQMGKGLSLVSDESGAATEQVKKTADTAGELAGKVAELSNDVAPAADELKQMGEASIETSGAMETVAGQMEKTASSMTNLDAASKQYGSEQEKLNALIAEAQEKGLNYVAGIKDGVAQIKILGDAHSGASKQIDTTTQAVDKLSDRERLAIENAHDMEKTLLELASNERIKAMEFTARIKVAELEKDAEVVKATMESLQSIFDNTADVLSELVAGFDSAFLPEDREFFKRMIEERLQLEKDAFELQKKTAEAEIRKIEAEAEALLNGMDINISASGLEPEIEAFMFKILERIQTKIVGDKTAFLLGAGV